jgi:3-deoxy-D-manno-octulosonate 8-phosphate phosphatase (KDO 8-P phosphatase)
VPLKKIKMLIMDVDGVLTDGSILLDAHGEDIKVFNSQDGAGIKYLHRAGLKCAILSGRSSPAVEARAKELEIEDVFQGAKDKVVSYEQIRTRRQLTDAEVCYIGDDLTDIPVLRRVGFPVAVANARKEVKKAARFVTSAPGGHGAVREVIEKILKEQDKWELILKRYGL